MAEELKFAARDGRTLSGTLFKAIAPVGTVVIASAMGVRRRLYAGVAEHLAQAGLTTLIFDYRGIGDSREGSLRGFKAELHQWGELDLAGAFDFLHAREPSLPLQILTHSVGGQIFGLIEDANVAGAIFVGSQSGSWRLWRGLGRVGMFALWHGIMPGLVASLGYLPMRVLGQGEDLPGGVAAEWARWGRQSDYVWSYAGPRGGLGFTRWSGPLVSYAIADDAYAPRAGVEGLLALYTAAKTELKFVVPKELGAAKIGHFGAFRPAFRDTLWNEWRDTLLSRVAPLAQASSR